MPEVDPDFFTEFEKSLPHHEMILVEGGRFLMGNGEEDVVRREKPVHEVDVPSFFMGKYLITQAIWRKMMSYNPSGFKGDNRPVETISHHDTRIFIKKLNELTGKLYRLPSEAEWEFAARGGLYSEGYKYSGSDRLKEVGWFIENSEEKTHPVGTKLSNELGLYDMSGNVWEWVADRWNDTYEGAPIDGSAWLKKESYNRCVVRGGSWNLIARDCRLSFRNYNSPDSRGSFIGFRLALSLSG